jgi:hypothetical protein
MAFRSGNSRASKIAPAQVLDLREKYAQGRTQGSLAREYRLSVGQVGRIVRGESWQQFETVATDHDLRVEGAMRRQAFAAEVPQQELDTSAQKLFAQLDADVKPRAVPSLLDRPPTEDEDQAAANRTQDRLDSVVIKPSLDKQASEALGKLEKGD